MEKELESIFIETLERNKDRIYRICCSYTTELEDPRDLYQDVVLNLWKSIPSFRHESSIDTWLYRITVNICLRARNTYINKNKFFVKLESIHFRKPEEPSVVSEENELYQKLFEAIKKLDETYKSIILLHLEGLSHKSIGEILCLSENHVAVRIKRAKSRLLILMKS